MLTRQLASAGSGKTYTLAKQFIRLFLTVPVTEEPGAEKLSERRLRTRAELSGALRRILAITFTNKATGEMKERIISKLASLASFREGADPMAIDYLTEFTEELGVAPGEIAKSAGEALDVLLNEFSDFQVSTIDSFFQQVMRTFTYEAELPDNYQIELDSNYVASLGLDSALTDLNTDTSSASEMFKFWARRTIQEEMNRTGGWNIFTPGRKTLYTKVLDMLKTMESESFKENLQKLTDFLKAKEKEGKPETGGYISELIRRYDAIHILPLRHSLGEAREAARAALRHAERNGLTEKDLARFLYGRLTKIAGQSWESGSISDKVDGDTFLNLKTATAKGVDCSPEFLELVRSVGKPYNEYLRRYSDPETRSWLVYSDALRRLALTWEIRKKINELMLDSGTLQLSDTNSILRTIIGDDETPFIYERLGSKLDHFLIDEFQDTSRLQWENILPLLRESESRGKENLIIGDPKQSIYRFRNADSSLITTAVGLEFPGLRDAGADPKTNTNWRSSFNIVRFNNFFFHALAEAGMDYSKSYGDVIQFSKHYNPENSGKSRKEGYVRLNFFREEKNSSTDDKSENNEESESKRTYQEVCRIITDLIGRGYRQKEIAVLVRTHDHGADVIDAIIEYNSRAAANGTEQIRFVSEDSLKISGARGVQTVLEALGAICGRRRFTRPALNGEEHRTAEEPVNPLEKFSIFTDRNAPKLNEDLKRMLSGMKVMTLPAIVEQVIRDFVPEAVRKAEAPFLAAFQDTVLEFSDNHIADVPTFLGWWDKHGGSLSIASPESTDAVQVVTVHSSKGLEFDAVIVPDANYSFKAYRSGSRAETAWIAPAIREETEAPLPPVLPIDIKENLKGTYHEAMLAENDSQVATDRLNALYVAFTRAKYELYALFDISKSDWEKIRKEIAEKGERLFPSGENWADETGLPVFGNAARGVFGTLFAPEEILGRLPEEKRPYVIETEDMKLDLIASERGRRDTVQLTYGKPIDREIIRKEEEKKNRNRGDSGEPEKHSFSVETYSVSDCFPALHCQTGTPLPGVDDSSDLIPENYEADDSRFETTSSDKDKPVENEMELEESLIEEDEIIPGSERALLRELQARLAINRDLDRAMLPLEISGRWSDMPLEDMRGVIERFLTSPNGAQFLFPPEGWTVFTNRPLLSAKGRTRTPDRIHISPDGRKAMLINFKLTTVPSTDELRQLAAHVRAFRRTGFAGEVEAWLCSLPSATVTPLKKL